MSRFVFITSSENENKKKKKGDVMDKNRVTSKLYFPKK